jgi:hypothetical protein
MGTFAVGTIPPATMFGRRLHHVASFGSHLFTFFSLEIEALKGQLLSIQTVLEGTATKGAQLFEAAGIDIDLSLTVVLFVKQVDQFPSGAAVKIAAGVDMQVAVTLFIFDLEITAH